MSENLGGGEVLAVIDNIVKKKYSELFVMVPKLALLAFFSLNPLLAEYFKMFNSSTNMAVQLDYGKQKESIAIKQ